MDVALGGFRAQLERPQIRKFAWPIVILPELFTAPRHLTIMAGHLIGRGWEVYLVDIEPLLTRTLVRGQVGASSFAVLADCLRRSLATIGSDIVAAGHGLGGLLALKLAEAPPVRAGVALAPLIPGVNSPLLIQRNRWAFWRSRTAVLPTRRKMLELVSDAEPFQREALIKALRPMDTSAVMEIARGIVKLEEHQAPRMIIAGETDSFAPWREAERLAAKIHACFISLPARGHWLIAGRALERSIAHMQRFLVQSLGEEVLLLYDEPNSGEPEA